MPPESRPGGEKKKQSIAEALLSSNSQSRGNLHGPVLSGAYKRLLDLASYLDLTTKKAVQDFLRSPQFLPYYESLYKESISPRITNDLNLQGPQLKAVQSAIEVGEGHGDQKYTGDDINKGK